ALVTETDAEDGDGRAELPDHLEAHARVLGLTRAGRDEDALGAHRGDVADGDSVVPSHLHLRSELAEVLYEVVGKRVVIVDDEDQGRLSPEVMNSREAIGQGSGTPRAAQRAWCDRSRRPTRASCHAFWPMA